jgi:hypothetical protein
MEISDDLSSYIYI